MPLLQFPITRAGNTYDVTIGVTPEGKSRLYFETQFTDEVHGLRYRYYWLGFNTRTSINSTEGELDYIQTLWKKVAISPSGTLIPGTESLDEMITNNHDIAFFISGLGMPILMSILNGFVRSNLGFNHLPVFETSNFTLKSYSEFLESTEPTNDYNTYVSGDPLPDSLTEPEDDTDTPNP